MDRRTRKVVEGFKKIPGQYLTRIVYEVTPFKKSINWYKTFFK